MTYNDQALPILDADIEFITDAADLARFASSRLGVLDMIDAEFVTADADAEWCADCDGAGVVGLLGQDGIDVPCLTCNGSGVAL